MFFVQTIEQNTYRNTATQSITREKERNECDLCVIGMYSMDQHHNDGGNSVCLTECWGHAKFYLQRKDYAMNSWLNDNTGVV